MDEKLRQRLIDAVKECTAPDPYDCIGVVEAVDTVLAEIERTHTLIPTAEYAQMAEVVAAARAVELSARTVRPDGERYIDTYLSESQWNRLRVALDLPGATVDTD